MSGQVATMSVKFAADIADFEKNVTKAEKTFTKSGKAMTDMGDSLALKLTAPFLAITGVMAKSAADAEASMARFTRIFGPATDQVDAFAKQMMKVLPETRSEIEQLLGTTQAFVAQLGLAPRATIAMTESLTKLAGDIAAFRHIDITDVMQTLERGMAGRTQGLVGLGIAINKVEVAERARQMGLVETGQKLTVAAQSEATLALVIEKTRNIQGEAAKTAGDAANALKFLHQATTELGEEWGKTLLPLATNLVHGLTDVARELSSADDATKLFAISTLGIAAAGGPALIVIGSLARSMVDLEKSVRLLTGIEGLAGLAVGGAVIVAVVAGLTAIGYWIYKSGEDARNAKAAVEDYKTSLIGLSAVQLAPKVASAYSNLEFASGNLAAAKATPIALRKVDRLTGAKIYDTSARDSAVAAAQLAYDTAQKVAQEATSAYNNAAQMTFVKAGAATLGGDGAAAASKKVFDEFVAQADTLLKVQPQLEQGWSGIDKIGNMQLSMYDRLARALGAQTDQYSDQAIKLRDLIVQYQALHAVQLVTGTTMMTPQSLMQVTPGLPLGVNGQGYSILPQIPASAIPAQGKLPSIPSHIPGVETKLDELGGIFKDAIASQASFIAQSLATVLGIRQANAGGAIGSTLGGALGSATSLATIGAITTASGLGAVLGSVALPIVGTLAGGLIGNAIGSLFGGSKKAVDNSSSALNALAASAQKVSESLSNVPTGFKIALARYEATTGLQVPTYGGNGSPTTSGPTPIIIQGDVHFNGVQDIAAMYDQLTTHATIKGARGGTQPLSLALGVRK